MACVRVCPADAEARYLKRLYGAGTPIVYAGVCLTEGGPDVDAAITFEDLDDVFRRRGVVVAKQDEYFTRVPEERRRHLSMAGGLPLEVLLEETQASRRFRKVRGLGGLGAIARAVAVDRLDLGFVDILPCEGCLDHPLLGPRDELFRRREIVGATEPARSRAPVVEEAVARGVQVAEAFPVTKNGHRPQAEAVDAVLKEIGLAPNGKPWDCGACGYPTCRMFANAAALGRTTLRSCPPYLDRQARLAQLQAAVQVAEAFPVTKNGHRPQAEAVDAVLKEIGLAPNGKPWDCGACGYPTCRMFANAAALGRTTLRSCPPYLDRQARLAQLQAAVDGLT